MASCAEATTGWDVAMMAVVMLGFIGILVGLFYSVHKWWD